VIFYISIYQIRYQRSNRIVSTVFYLDLTNTPTGETLDSIDGVALGIMSELPERYSPYKSVTVCLSFYCQRKVQSRAPKSVDEHHEMNYL